MAQPKVSIIVPVYNAEKYLDRCIRSLRNQTLKDLEIILVDDGSLDGSPEMCRKAAREDFRIKVLHKKNEGAGKARNAGMAIATGEYIGFVDSDDFVEPDMYQTLLEKAERYGSDLVMSGVIFVDGNMFSQEGERSCKTYFQKDTLFETVQQRNELRMGVVGAAPGDADDSKYGMSIWKNLFRHEIIQKNRIRFESEREMMSEDALFMIDYISCIDKAVGIPEVFYNYCRNGESISKSYKKDRFEKLLVFTEQVETRFGEDLASEEYRLYIDRFWQAMCRVFCCQEIMHGADNKIPFRDTKKRLEVICTHPRTVSVLRSYPLNKLPLKQGIFAYGMKYRLYFLLSVLVALRRK